MTKATKPVSRETDGHIREQGKLRPIIVSIEPGGIISFRAKGCRRSYAMTVEGCYDLAVKKSLDQERAMKRRAKR
jgi:hypothetical protein